MKQFLGIVGINIVVLGFLIFVLNAASIATIQIFNWQKPKQYAQSHLFPNYKDDPEAAKVMFGEYDNLTKGYYESFYAWRRPETKSTTINIDENGQRVTFQPEGGNPTKKIAFFGGSTTWGTGADDMATIPSFVAKQLPDFEATNYGETGYVAHQSLNRFLKHYYEGYRPEVVVFYDGVNDVWNKCRRELGPYSHSRELDIRTTLEEGSASNPESFWFIIQPLRNLAGKVARVLKKRSQDSTAFYDCDKDAAKAEQVARFLLSDWQIMKDIVEGYGGEFISILQPHAFVSKTPLDHLKLDPALGEQYSAVYPKVLELLDSEFPDLKPNFVNLTHALDTDEYVYIDWCHLSPNGNEMVASFMLEEIGKRVPQKTTALN
ncbi:MAG: SGNH/GDSL hydrolase family protein [Stappiaceae bacterium]